MATGIILFAHGARDARWAEPLARLRAKVEATRPDVAVRAAFLDFMQPDLANAAEELVAAGCTHLRVEPVFIAMGGHMREDVPRIVAGVRARHPGVAIEVQEALGEHEAVLDRMAHAAVEALAR